jgi:hypothetical protein
MGLGMRRGCEEMREERKMNVEKNVERVRNEVRKN